MINSSLAVDIGASGGRVIAGYLNNNKLYTASIHEFKNEVIEKDGLFYWDLQSLFVEIKTGIKKCKNYGLAPKSIGIDTWGVDFVLLDERDNLFSKPVSYRDSRTDGMMKKVFKKIDKKNIYLKTGIQFMKINTIYQLYAIKINQPEILSKAKSFLMIPDYFNFLLTGKKINEYTNATTTQLVNAHTKEWDQNILGNLEINDTIFKKILPPKTIIGGLTKELKLELGFNMKVILPATHDTGSAVVATPNADHSIYISSGTWSLIGVETSSPICTNIAQQYNFTNEGGINYRFRFLKNIMGLWMLQEVKRENHNKYSFTELAELSRKETDFYSIVNVDKDRFIKPESMTREIQSYCRETKQQVPDNLGQLTKCIFDSLVRSYNTAINQIEKIFNKNIKYINIVGGGSKNDTLNQLIANTSNKTVIAGPKEATSIGNVASQLIAMGEIGNLSEARNIIQQSFKMETYTPKNKLEE